MTHIDDVTYNVEPSQESVSPFWLWKKKNKVASQF